MSFNTSVDYDNIYIEGQSEKMLVKNAKMEIPFCLVNPGKEGIWVYLIFSWKGNKILKFYFVNIIHSRSFIK